MHRPSGFCGRAAPAPAHPRLTRGNAAPLAQVIAVDGAHAFVAASAEGLQVFELSPASSSVPKLTLSRVGDSVTLRWPATPAGFGLESSEALGSTPIWQPEPAAPAVAGDQNVVTLEIGTGSRFFRLRKR